MRNPATAAIITESTTPATFRTGGDVPFSYCLATITLDGTVCHYLFHGDAWKLDPATPAVGRLQPTSGHQWRATDATGAVLVANVDHAAAVAALTSFHATALAVGAIAPNTGRPAVGERRMFFTMQPCGPDGNAINDGQHYGNANTIDDARAFARRVLEAQYGGKYLGYRVDSVDISGRLMTFGGDCWRPVAGPDARSTHELVQRPGPHLCDPACYDTHATRWDRASDAAERCDDQRHRDLYPDTTAESIQAHVTAHLPATA